MSPVYVTKSMDVMNKPWQLEKNRKHYVFYACKSHTQVDITTFQT